VILRKTAIVPIVMASFILALVIAQTRPKDARADTPVIHPSFYCVNSNNYTCPLRSFCDSSPPGSYYCSGGQGLTQTNGTCQGPNVTSCTTFGTISCGYQYSCATNVATTDPPTQCMQTYEPCQTVLQ